MSRTIRIGGALGYWGDRTDALTDLLEGGPLDYVILDYLSEVTLSILEKQRSRNSRPGYPHDFVPLMRSALPLLRRTGVRLTTNAGGLDPLGLAEELLGAARELGWHDMTVGIVHGDDLIPRMDEFARLGIEFPNTDTGERRMPGRLTSANAYFGAFPVAEALSSGADIVVTGRVNDAALALGPLIAEFGWSPRDYDLLARGTIAGHLLECGGQASGGNYSKAWQEVPDLCNLGFPIGEVAEDGSLTVTIHPGRGGLVTPAVLKEQLLYEIGDPAAYIVADCACDITGLEMQDLGDNRVKVWGVRGHPPTDHYKVSMSYEGGYRIVCGLLYTWPDCVAKARASSEVVLRRLDKLGIAYRDVHVSLVGYDAIHGPMAHRTPDPDEVYLRMAFAVDDPATADRITREVITHVLCGVAGGCLPDVVRQKPQRQVVFWPSRIPKSAVAPVVSVRGGA